MAARSARLRRGVLAAVVVFLTLLAAQAMDDPYVSPRWQWRAVAIGVGALILFGDLVVLALWRWSLLRRSRRLAPDAQRRMRLLVSRHERGVLTSDELRAAWKELSAERRA